MRIPVTLFITHLLILTKKGLPTTYHRFGSKIKHLLLLICTCTIVLHCTQNINLMNETYADGIIIEYRNDGLATYTVCNTDCVHSFIVRCVCSNNYALTYCHNNCVWPRWTVTQHEFEWMKMRSLVFVLQVRVKI